MLQSAALTTAKPASLDIVEPGTEHRQLTLKKFDVYRLPDMPFELHVVSGWAWITRNGNDLILKAGERCYLQPSPNGVCVSALYSKPLTIAIVEQL
jgi:hypothetical protein